MTISIDTPVETISSYESSIKLTKSAFEKLQREGDFYQSAWEDVLPFLMAIRGELIADWGFEGAEQSDVSVSALQIHNHFRVQQS
jgi:hypothetical protein